MTAIIAISFFILLTYFDRANVFYAPTLLGLSSISVAVVSLRNAKIDRLEPYVLLALGQFLLIQLCQVNDLLSFTCISSVLNSVWIGLCYFRNHSRRVAEIATKLCLLSLFHFCFFAFIIAWSIQHGYSLEFAELAKQSDWFGRILLLVAILFWIGASPFVLRFVDALDGAPAFASIHFFAGSLLSGGPVLQVICSQLIEAQFTLPLTIFGFVSLILPAFAALDQTRIDRLVAFLLMTQSGVLVLTTVHAPQLLPYFYLQLAFSVPGAIVGLHFWKHPKQSDKNWEDFAGAGQKHPWTSLAWMSILASLCGLPFTLGFSFYEGFTRSALSKSEPLFLAAAVASIVLAMTPVARLAAFMFCKPTRHELMKFHQPRQTALIFICACALLMTKVMTLLVFNRSELFHLVGQLSH